MMRHSEIERSRDALIAAVERIGGTRLGSMVIYSTARVCLIVKGHKKLNRASLRIRFVFDKNWPKFQIDALESEGFHTEYSVAWQQMSFNEAKGTLIVRGASERAPDGYTLHVHVKRGKASRDA